MQQRHSSFFAASGQRQKALTISEKTTAPLLREGRGFTFYLRKCLKAFSLKMRVVSTETALAATRQMKLSTLVKAACRYDMPFLRSLKLQIHTE